MDQFSEAEFTVFAALGNGAIKAGFCSVTEIGRFEGHEASAIIANKSFSNDGRQAPSLGWDKTGRLMKLPLAEQDGEEEKKQLVVVREMIIGR